jgi:hypothetical protein
MLNSTKRVIKAYLRGAGSQRVRTFVFWTICVSILVITQVWAQTRLNKNQLPIGTTATVANGIATLGTSLIGSGACASVVTVSATGVLTTDNIMADFNGDPTGVVGYQPSANGTLTIFKYPTANNVNFKVCNNTGAGITPGAITLNWRVPR